MNLILPKYKPFKWDHKTKVAHISSVLHILEEFYTKNHTYLWKPQVHRLTKRNTISWKVEEDLYCYSTEEAARLILMNNNLDLEIKR